jgi:hypothetical protein
VDKNSAKELDKLAKERKQEELIHKQFIKSVRDKLINNKNSNSNHPYHQVVEINRKLKYINEDVYNEKDIYRVTKLKSRKLALIRKLIREHDEEEKSEKPQPIAKRTRTNRAKQNSDELNRITRKYNATKIRSAKTRTTAFDQTSNVNAGSSRNNTRSAKPKL